MSPPWICFTSRSISAVGAPMLGIQQRYLGRNFRWVLEVRRAILRAVPIKYRPRGSQKNLEIKPERPVLGVAQIQAHHLVESGTVASTHLPEPGHSGF